MLPFPDMTDPPIENLLDRADAGIAIVTINRPKVLNALNAQTLDELRRTILALRRDEAVRCVILTGAGEKSFIAGADINELAVQTPVSGRQHALSGQHVLDLIENLGKPVIAAINGFALGGGCELAMACTIRIAADTARSSGSRRSTSASFLATPARSGWRVWSAGAARSSCC